MLVTVRQRDGIIGTAVQHGKILVGIYKYLTVMYFLYSKKDQYKHLNEMLSVMESVVEVCDKLGDHKFSSFNYLLFRFCAICVKTDHIL